MGNNLCQSDGSESFEMPSMQNPESKQRGKNSTVAPNDSGSQKSELSGEEHPHQNNQGEIANQNEGSKAEEEKPILHSNTVHSPVNYDNMQIIGLSFKRKRINQFEINAPFEVIMMTISTQLRHTINGAGHDLFEKYYRQNGTTGWKLHKNGFYINYLGKKLTAILTQEVYFEGELEENESNIILPKASGILLNKNGRYQGKFHLGKATGQGSFEDIKKKTHFKGIWEGGRLIRGIINSQQYTYKGTFNNSIAHGDGQLYFKQKEIYYKGKFKQGEYYDKDAKYETKGYVYKGTFINGKKNGEGVLVQKERSYKNNKGKYHPPAQFNGNWNEDIYLNKEAMSKIKAAKDGTPDSKIDPDEYPGPIIKEVVFQQFEDTTSKKSDRRVGVPQPIDDFAQMKPKFIWVEPPRAEKKKKKKRDEDEQNSQIF